MTNLNIKRMVTRRLPILAWIPNYTFGKFIFDLIAGITVGLMLMPQSLANAALAGLEPEYGLYAAFVGGFVYFFLGTNKNVTIGSEAVLCLMVYQQVVDTNADYAILLSFLTGIVQLLMVVLRLDVLMDFFSVPVIAGYISASSITIASSQLKNLFGLKVSSSGFLEDITEVARNAKKIKYNDLLLGIACIVVLICLRSLQNFKIKSDGEKPSDAQNKWNHVFKLVSNSRNIIVILICSVVTYCCETYGNGSPFTLTGTVEAGLPDFHIPPFSTVDKEGASVSLIDMLTELGASVVLVPVLSAVTNIAIVKNFATNGKIDASQELFCVGVINVCGSFFSSMPVTASFSRSSVNEASGVQTPAGGIVTSILVLLTLQFLTPYLFYIPKTSLAALVISAIIFMIEYEVVKPIWRTNKGDFLTLVVTFFACLFLEIQYGILLGVIVNIVFLLWSSVRPAVTIDIQQNKSGSQYFLITPKSSLYFPSVDYVNTKIGKAVTSSEVMPVVINCQYIMNIDFTAATGLSYFMEECFLRKQPLYFINTEDRVASVFQKILNNNFNHFKSLQECEAHLQDEHFVDSKKHRKRSSTFVLRKFSVPLASVISIDDEPISNRRRHSTLHHH